MALIEKLTAIADAVRDKTGGIEPLTLDQIPLAIDGITTGGSGNALAYDMGEFVLDKDLPFHKAEIGIIHELGEKPGFVVVWTDDFAECSEDNPAPILTNVGYVILLGLTGLPQRLTSTADTDYGLYFPFYIQNESYNITTYIPTSHSYTITQRYEATSTAIGLPHFGTGGYWRAGITYKYFVSKAWWNVGGAVNAE